MMTAQIPEMLIYKDLKLEMCDEPLFFYPLQFSFNKKGKEVLWTNTACWRGYVGIWRIIRKKLYLVDIDGYFKDETKMTVDDIEPATTHGVFAWWLSQEVRCGVGQVIDYVHSGYSSTFEKDLFLKFENGLLVQERLVTNVIN